MLKKLLLPNVPVAKRFNEISNHKFLSSVSGPETKRLALDANEQDTSDYRKFTPTVNNVFLIGYVGKDAEYVSDERSAAVFSCATQRYREIGENMFKNEVQWHRVIVSGRAKDVVVQKVKAGDLVHVYGEINYAKYSPKRWPELTVTSTSILAKIVKILNAKKNRKTTETPTGEEEIEINVNEGETYDNIK